MSEQDKRYCELCGQPLAQEAMQQYENKLQKDKKEKDEINQQKLDLDKQEAGIKQKTADAVNKALADKEEEQKAAVNKALADKEEEQKAAVNKALADKEEEQKAAVDKVAAKKDMEMMAYKKSVEIDNERKQKKIMDLQTGQTSQLPNELKGEGLEDTIEDLLKNWFPKDKIEAIAKGKKGGDHLQTVMHNNKEAGKIKIECKNTKKWTDSWLKEILEDMTRYEATFGIIITKATPDNFEIPFTIVENNRVIICNLDNQNYIRRAVETFALSLIAVNKDKTTSENPAAVQELVNWVQSPRTTNTVQKMAKDITDDYDAIDKDERGLMLSIQKRRKRNEQRMKDLVNLFMPLKTLEMTKDLPFFDDEDDK